MTRRAGHGAGQKFSFLTCSALQAGIGTTALLFDGRCPPHGVPKRWNTLTNCGFSLALAPWFCSQAGQNPQELPLPAGQNSQLFWGWMFMLWTGTIPDCPGFSCEVAVSGILCLGQEQDGSETEPSRVCPLSQQEAAAEHTWCCSRWVKLPSPRWSTLSVPQHRLNSVLSGVCCILTWPCLKRHCFYGFS